MRRTLSKISQGALASRTKQKMSTGTGEQGRIKRLVGPTHLNNARVPLSLCYHMESHFVNVYI